MSRVKGHLTEHVSRARLALEVRRSLRPAVVIAAGAALSLACAAYLLTNLGSGVGGSTYEARFAVHDANAVTPGRNEVRIAGVRAGTITEVERVGRRTVLTAQIESKYGRVHRDARAALRPNTQLQDMFLDVVDRGTPAAGTLEADAPLPASRTSTTVDVAEVLQVFEGDTRARLHGMLRDLGGGLRGRGADLREAFVEVVPFLHVLRRLSDELSERADSTRRLVRNTSLLTEELGRRDRDLHRLVRDGGAVFADLSAGARDLDATIRELPPTLAAVDVGFSDLQGVLDDVDGALRALGPVAGELPAGLRALRRLGAAATPAVRELRGPMQRLVPLAEVLPPLSADLRTATGALRPQTGALDHASKVLTGCMRPVTQALHQVPSVMKVGDARGPILRGAWLFGLDSVQNVVDPDVHRPGGCVQAGKGG